MATVISSCHMMGMKKVQVTRLYPTETEIYMDSSSEQTAVEDSAVKILMSALKPWMFMSRFISLWEVDLDSTAAAAGKGSVSCLSVRARKVCRVVKALVLVLCWASSLASVHRIYTNFAQNKLKMLEHGKYISVLLHSIGAGWILTMAFLYRGTYARDARDFLAMMRTLSQQSVTFMRKASLICLLTFLPLSLLPIWGYVVHYYEQTYADRFSYRYHPPVLALLVIISILMQSVILLFSFIYCLVCLGLSRRLQELNAEVQQLLTTTGGITRKETMFATELSSIFTTYKRMCQLVCQWDGNVAAAVFILFLGGYVLCLTNLYLLLFDPNRYDKITNAMIIATTIFIFVTLCLLPDKLKKKMKAFSAVMHEVCEWASEQLVESDGISLVMKAINCKELTRATHCTMCSFFSLDRTYLLALFSFALTYFIVLTQFHVSGA